MKTIINALQAENIDHYSEGDTVYIGAVFQAVYRPSYNSRSDGLFLKSAHSELEDIPNWIPDADFIYNHGAEFRNIFGKNI